MNLLFVEQRYKILSNFDYRRDLTVQIERPIEKVEVVNAQIASS